MISAGDARSGATFSEDGRYRYSLWRLGGEGHPVLFVGLNPSTADAIEDDPTIRRCRGFVRDWGYAGLFMGNLMAFRATDPKDVVAAETAGVDPFGPENDEALVRMAAKAPLVIAAWGAHPLAAGAMRYLRLLLGRDRPVHCLGCTKDGSPRHPLYVKAATWPELIR